MSLPLLRSSLFSALVAVFVASAPLGVRGDVGVTDGPKGVWSHQRKRLWELPCHQIQTEPIGLELWNRSSSSPALRETLLALSLLCTLPACLPALARSSDRSGTRLASCRKPTLVVPHTIRPPFRRSEQDYYMSIRSVSRTSGPVPYASSKERFFLLKNPNKKNRLQAALRSLRKSRTHLHGGHGSRQTRPFRDSPIIRQGCWT